MEILENNVKEPKIVRRGFCPEDEKLFKGEGLNKVKEAAKDALFLLNRGYKVKQATMFVGNHYALDERQRLVLARALATDKDIQIRKSKISTNLKGSEVYIDGFNAIIPMETTLSNSLLLECMDGAIRDLANLRGSYHIIDKTDGAIRLILKKLDELEIKKATIYLDKPISNSGRLKLKILEVSKDFKVEVIVEVLNAVDRELYNKENVISGDCIVLDNCKSWIPLYKMIIDDIDDKWIINFNKLNLK